MSVTLQINGSERDVTRLFHIDLPQEAIDRFTRPAGTGEWPLQYALGADKLRPAFTEAVDITDLGDMPLSRYLTEAHGVRWDSGYDKSQVDALKGHVLILPSQAFGHVTQTLNVQTPLRWIGTYGEITPAPAQGSIDTQAARFKQDVDVPAAGRRGSAPLKLVVAAVVAVVLVVLWWLL